MEPQADKMQAKGSIMEYWNGFKTKPEGSKMKPEGIKIDQEEIEMDPEGMMM